MHKQRAIRGPFLVTGATGFIGSNLVRALISLGERVHVIHRPGSDRWRIADLSSTYINEQYCDLRDGAQLREIVRDIKPKIVFHCAAYGVNHFQTNVNDIFSTDVLGTINLIQALSTIEFDVCINTGSFFEYGNKPMPVKEDITPEPLNAYGAAKLASTLYCQMIGRCDGFPVVTLRLFYPYGPYEGPNRLISAIVRACLERRELDLTAGDQIRDCIFIGDVVDAYLKTAETTDLAGEVFNIGSGTGYTVKEVVEQAVSLSGASIIPHWDRLPMRKYDVTRCSADISRARQFLGWTPQVTLSQGLLKMITWHRSLINQ